MSLRSITQKTIAAIGLKPVAYKGLDALGLQPVPRRPNKRFYPQPMSPNALHEATHISFPQADLLYDPPLFYPRRLRQRIETLATNRHVENAFTTLYATLCSLGYAVNHETPQKADLAIGWKSPLGDVDFDKHAKRPPVLVMETGWLPRSTYQISDCGANALSHVAKQYRFRNLTAGQEQLVHNHVVRMRQIFRLNVNADRVSALGKELAEPFILFPFQIARDMNLLHSNTEFRRFYYNTKVSGNIAFAQACIDHLEAARLPLPILFKQHPVDRTDLRSTLKLRDPKNQILTNDQKISTLDLFASGQCKLVVSVNSNTLHEALAWNIPTISLGTLIWDESREDRPLDKDLSAAERLLGQENAMDPTRLSYLYHLMTNQWHLSDLQNPLIVQELMRTRGHAVPYELRCRLGLDLAMAVEKAETTATNSSNKINSGQ